jgi:hypothetical protein
MPLVAFADEAGHARERFLHTSADLGAETLVCACGATMTPVLSVGRGLTWFRASAPRVIHNLGHEPVVVRSHEDHKRLMRERGVDWATAGRGRKGCWV